LLADAGIFSVSVFSEDDATIDTVPLINSITGHLLAIHAWFRMSLTNLNIVLLVEKRMLLLLL
jgi:hypothetical protein